VYTNRAVFLKRDRFIRRQIDRHVLAQFLFRRGRRVQYHRRQLQVQERTAAGVRQLRSVVGGNEKGIRHHVSIVDRPCPIPNTQIHLSFPSTPGKLVLIRVGYDYPLSRVNFSVIPFVYIFELYGFVVASDAL